ncbi:MAG: selenide, water dikinase SelD [Parvularculaceae bacterium]|nr:selenide, water dikinase SelD [Parvularculaceae bacterium]
MTQPPSEPKLTSLAHGGGCGCKLAPNVLSDILSGMPAGLAPKDLIVDAATSDDAAVWRINDETAIVATTDFFMPVVDDPYDFGRIAATNAISDVYAMGAQPIFSLALVGMPIGKIGTATIRKILEGGRSVAEAAGAPIAGGHSIDSVEPIYGLVALGLVHPDRILKNCGAEEGDALILGKPLGIGVFSAALKKGVLSADDYAAMIASTTLLNRPGAGLGAISGVHAVTDVTGFGLLGHLAEVCRGSSVAARIERKAVPVFDGARRLVQEGMRTGASPRNWASVSAMIDPPADWSEADRDLLCDPQTSGGLLVSCAPEAVDAVLTQFAACGHANASVIGRIEVGAPRISVL